MKKRWMGYRSYECLDNKFDYSEVTDDSAFKYSKTHL